MFPMRRALLQAQNLVRSISTDVTKFGRKGLGRDPGISARREEIIPTYSPNELEGEEDFFDDFESDFMDVGKSHKDHVREHEAHKEKTKFQIVRDKYFKEKLPNFLTMHDKEQIKYLHRTNPEEWTVEQLSEGFPATPEIITRICKSNWVKKPYKIANHDAGVVKNWELFKAGEMPQLPRELAAHLRKFTNRALNFKPFEMGSDDKVYEKPLVKGEFSQILDSYEKLKEKNKHQEEIKMEKTVRSSRNKIERPPDSDTYVLPYTKKKEDHITLSALKEDLEKRQKAGEVLEIDEQLMINRPNDKTHEEVVEIKENVCEIIPKKDHTLKVMKTEADQKHLEYPDKISIPKKLKCREFNKERQRVYKLYDCYYDYDGRFLYRVPGME